MRVTCPPASMAVRVTSRLGGTGASVPMVTWEVSNVMPPLHLRLRLRPPTEGRLTTPRRCLPLHTVQTIMPRAPVLLVTEASVPAGLCAPPTTSAVEVRSAVPTPVEAATAIDYQLKDIIGCRITDPVHCREIMVQPLLSVASVGCSISLGTPRRLQSVC